MKFLNETSENIKYRIGSYTTGFEWYTARPGCVVDIPLASGKHSGLTLIEEQKPFVPVFMAKKPAPSIAGKAREEYKKSLVSLKGIGKKTAEEIIDEYPDLKTLQDAVDTGCEVHNHDGVDAAIHEWLK